MLPGVRGEGVKFIWGWTAFVLLVDALSGGDSLNEKQWVELALAVACAFVCLTLDDEDGGAA